MSVSVPRLLATAATGLAVAVLSLSATLPAGAQSGGFALEVGPAADDWTGVRIALAVFGETVEPASGYVRGCAGHVVAEAAGVQLDVTERMGLLTLSVADDSVSSLVVATPDGLYRCALPGADGLIQARIADAAPGRYRVWLGGDEAAQVSARMIVADRPVSAMELRGLQVDSLGAPRAGQHVFDPEAGRQVLAGAATLRPESAMQALSSADYCAGYSSFDAADAVLTLAEVESAVSFFARSERDLTIAVRGPDGRILCNDDSFGLNPAVTFAPAPAGDYHVFVGAYSQGGTAQFDLFASQGDAAWDDARYRPDAAPRTGRYTFPAGGAARLLGRGEIVAQQAFSRLPIDGFCPGFTGIEAPDAVLTLAEQEARLSVYAASDFDLVLALRAADGSWYCNDDSYGLNPAVTVDGAEPGEYAVYVGAYSQGANGSYGLFAAAGEPDWTLAEGAQGGGARLAADAPPAVGEIPFGPETRIDPRLIFDIQPSEAEAFGLGEACAGFITFEQPDVVISALPALPQLMVYMVSEADGVLVVVGPDGRLHCNDDFDGLNPGVMIPNPEPGDYAVFAGTYGGDGGLATLGVTVANPLWVMDREH